jgi:NOL1/NOP2/sun family putative RNA methylase
MDLIEKKQKFLEKIEELYPDNFKQIISNIKDPKPLTFRVNLLKATKDEVMCELKDEDFIVNPGPLDNTFIVEGSSGKKRLSETEAFNDGRIYIQSLSSMLPVEFLDPTPGEKILDLCAAPGSKTSLIAQKSDNRAEIYAIENNRNRFFALQNNLKNLGVKNVRFILDNGRILDKKYPELCGYFDKILVDAPCSNEGLVVLSDPRSLEYWNPKLPKKLSKLQKGLVSTATSLLKPGGTLVYSTCTFSKEENEEVIDWVLKRFPDMKLEEFKRVEPDKLFTGFALARLSKLP